MKQAKMEKLLTGLLFLCSLTLSAQSLSLQAEPNHSTIGFRINIASFTEVTGKFTDYEIRIDFDQKNVTQSSFAADIKAESINTGISGRDEHLRSADFFDVEKFPLISFQSDSIQQINYANFIAYGTFSMHGISKPMQLPFSLINIDGNTLGFKIRSTLRRSDYELGLGFVHTAIPNFLADEIQIEIDFWTKKRKGD